jgi:hypothetical protein
VHLKRKKERKKEKGDSHLFLLFLAPGHDTARRDIGQTEVKR